MSTNKQLPFEDDSGESDIILNPRGYDSYQQFLQQKQKAHIESGFEANINHGWLFPFQNFVTNEAIRNGKFGIFSGTGTGKTRMQLAWSNAVLQHTNKPVLILAPLAVSGQTMQEAAKFNIEVSKLVRGDSQIYIINYEQLDNISQYIHLFGGIALDEASILKNFEGAYRNKIIDLFKFTPYKSVWTATPSPNDPMEIGNYSEFLDIMPRNEMLAMFFVHDGGETSKWRLKKHSRKIFWQWVSSWAIMFQKPQDIGFEQEGFDLPPLNLIEKQIVTGKRDNGLLFNDMAVSATNFNQELRLTKIERLDEVAEIVKQRPGEPFLIWIKQNEEGEYLRKLLPGAIEVKGSDEQADKERKLLGFAAGEFPIMITKTKIAGWGMNYQHCGNQIFASPDFSFEAVFQAIRRSLRFGRQGDVNAWIMTTDTMTNVVQTFKRKSDQFEEMQAEMTAASNEKRFKKIKPNRMFEEVKTENFHIQLGDCVELIRKVPDESIGFSIFSPPFAELYVYSDELEDMGNSKNYNEFLVAFRFLVKELYRVLWSGRNIAVHCMDLPIQKGKEGYIGLRDFSNMIREAFCGKTEELQKELNLLLSIEDDMRQEFAENCVKELSILLPTEDDKILKFDEEYSNWKRPLWLHERIEDIEQRIASAGDFIYHSRVTIWKDPVTEMQRTKALGLLHKQVKKDSAMSRVGLPDYLLVFRKPGEHKNPVHCDIPVDIWQQYASPVWMDIDYGDTLNGRKARGTNDEKHICPLQLPTIERAIHLWTNEGDTVLTPFMGIGSEVYQALRMGRRGVGFELKKSYYDVAVRNCRSAIEQNAQLQMF